MDLQIQWGEKIKNNQGLWMKLRKDGEQTNNHMKM